MRCSALLTRLIAISLALSAVEAFVSNSFKLTPKSSATRHNALSMLDTSDFKNGLTIEVDGAPVKIIDFLHVKPGKGSAFVRSKLKNLLTGNTNEKTFRAGESVQEAIVEKAELQFTYEADPNMAFMNMNTFEEELIPISMVGDNVDWIMEGSTVNCLKWNDQWIDVEVPKTLNLKVVETDPGVKGNTAQGGSKPAKLESGATVNVPLFISEGDEIRVDTIDRKYLGKA
uniref:Elongation factor P n=1 Tax=Fibrocapsa japonica TaxID=94617 RepID=A0A7S2UXP2_9STRA|mmetsp:Transcript_19103/g.27586  ORF Transcript_19103/g.27586 Transcript_19103/m.27586 type:complete len:229 (+) Transcript_19103:116-802(+)|eukprot:CAMPEP_0113944388 /NCGR_PEP_ID=MMETSP1339-20121228/34210_1 /TAXON_ID=94617 /ORGANISM="Fibrocapsa japonica" /LENGTH=228 /DNA_ID=CAMNT_0000949581 /DNA_START=87 /DNA_END=773 /DNA_ORIENTATION=- /assembly_acc=CAM_ASM_000762